jgi:hypothetical protein
LTRLLKIADEQPHLYPSIFNCLSKARRLSRNVSRHCLKLVRKKELYPAFGAALVRAMSGRTHDSMARPLQNYCRQHLRRNNAELLEACAANLLDVGALNWRTTRRLLTKHGWWVSGRLIDHVREDALGAASYSRLLNVLLRDSRADVSLTAADKVITENIPVHPPYRGVHRLAQVALKSAGLVGRISVSECPISNAMVTVLGRRLQGVNWREIVPDHRYKMMLGKVVRWKGYVETDATAWVNITDIMNDVILDALFAHDTTIGAYILGKIGSVLNPMSKFAKKYPQLFKCAMQFHEKRLESDLSHPITKRTGKTTRRIRFHEVPPLKKLLAKGYAEMWSKW